jgi:mono/diheme cytochrome c family protein
LSNVKTAAAGALALLALTGCTDWAGYDIDRAYDAVPQVATMRESVIPDYQEYPRNPAPGSVPVANPLGDIPAPYLNNQLDSVAPTLNNPFAGTRRNDVLVRGELIYTRNCTTCHGPTGAGDGPVVRRAKGANGTEHGRFPYAPPINGGTSVQRSDGYIYAVVEAGRGLMPPYGERITHMDRWAVVEYVRALQRRAGATGTAQPNPGGAVGAPTPAQTVQELPAASRDSIAPLNAPAPAAQPQGPR